MQYCNLTQSATQVLPMGSPKANGFHVETEIEQGAEYLLINKFNGYQKRMVERFPSSPTGFYYTYIKPIDEYVAMKTIFRNT